MFIDISRPLQVGMAIYPNNPPFSVKVMQKADSDKSGLSLIEMGSHTGTHIDTLSHIQAVGSGAESFPLEAFIGEVQVIDVTGVASVITAADIPEITAPRVLFKTDNSMQDRDVFLPDFVALQDDAAQKLLDAKVILVGIDSLSIKKKGVRDRVHALFLEHNVAIVEGLWLSEVAAGTYELLCLPLPLFHTDGVPARCILQTLF